MSGGGGDSEVKQSAEPFAQQLPYVQNVFQLADARRRSLTNGGYNTPIGGAGQLDYGGLGYNYGYGGTGGTGTGASNGWASPTQGFLGGGFPSFPGNNSTGNYQVPGNTNGQYLNNVDPTGAVNANTNDFQQTANDFGLPTLQFYPGSTVAGQSGDTRVAQGLARGAAGQVAGNNQAGTQALNNLMNEGNFTNPALQSLLAGPNVNNNPGLDAFANAATRPLLSQRDQALRSDDDRAIANGAFGGSRQQLNRGSIINDTAQAVGDVRAGIYNNAYNQQYAGQQNALGIAAQGDQARRGTQLQAQGQLGALNDQLTQPSDIFSRIGAQNEGFNQQIIDSERERFEFDQAAPDLAINQFANLINQFSGPTAATQRTSGAQGNSFGNAAGIALAGAGAAGLFGGS